MRRWPASSAIAAASCACASPTNAPPAWACRDRVTTVKAAVAEGARPEDLRHPGHVFPLRARPGGVLERRGHTEATVDLMSLAGLPPCGVLCELTNDDGTMARLPQVADFARANDLPLLAVADIVRWRERQEGRA